VPVSEALVAFIVAILPQDVSSRVSPLCAPAPHVPTLDSFFSVADASPDFALVDAASYPVWLAETVPADGRPAATLALLLVHAGAASGSAELGALGTVLGESFAAFDVVCLGGTLCGAASEKVASEARGDLAWAIITYIEKS
jgi:hypothetical protein